MQINSLSRRIDALLLEVRPAKSLAARLTTLTERERVAYAEYKTAYDKWMRRVTANGGNAFAALMDGLDPPQLPYALRQKLWPACKPILVSDDIGIAARKYQSGLEN